jgi:hypothetical protein
VTVLGPVPDLITRNSRRANVDRLDNAGTKASAAYVHCRSISGSAVASRQLSSRL